MHDAPRQCQGVTVQIGDPPSSMRSGIILMSMLSIAAAGTAVQCLCRTTSALLTQKRRWPRRNSRQPAEYYGPTDFLLISLGLASGANDDQIFHSRLSHIARYLPFCRFRQQCAR
jgi:hypothetical protein